MIRLVREARERPEVVVGEYDRIWAALLERADVPEVGDVDLLHSCLMVLGKSYEDFEVAAAALGKDASH